MIANLQSKCHLTKNIVAPPFNYLPLPHLHPPNVPMLGHQERERGGEARSLSVVLQLPKSSTKTFEGKVFSVAGARTWNSLPVDVRSTVNFDVFKKKIKTFLYSQIF